MVGFMNQAALDRTVESGFATFFSRTRNTLWMKGETSGNRLQGRSHPGRLRRRHAAAARDAARRRQRLPHGRADVFFQRPGTMTISKRCEIDRASTTVAVTQRSDTDRQEKEKGVIMVHDPFSFLRNLRRTTNYAQYSETRHSQGLPAGRDDSAVRARGIQHLRERAVVLSGDRRSGDRLHADSRAGDGALRGRRRARRRADRPGLDRGARRRKRATAAASRRWPI